MTDNEILIDLIERVCKQVDPVIKNSIKDNIDYVPSGKVKTFVNSVFLTLIGSILKGDSDIFQDDLVEDLCKGIISYFHSSSKHDVSHGSVQ